MFEGLRARIQVGRQKAELELDQLKVDRQIVALEQLQTSQLGGFLKGIQDPDESQWRALGGDEREKGLDSTDHATMQQQAVKLYYRNPHARNIIRLFEKYVCGRGFDIRSETEDESVTEYWDRFWNENGMNLRKKEIVRRTMRDGECFIRWFMVDAVPVIRFMEPSHVTDPDDPDEGVVGTLQEGIETNPEDVEEVLAYWFKGERIDAEEVSHFKILVDSDVVRGRSVLEVVAQKLAEYDKWLKDRIKLNTVRATVGLVKKVNGSPAAAAAVASKFETNTRKAADGTPFHRAPDGVSVFTTNQGVDYELMSPNLQAADVAADGRQILLAIAAGVGMPEFMVTSDASNANFASTLVAEAPGVREFLDWQDYFGEVFGVIFKRVMEAGMAAGEVPARVTIPMQSVNDETGELDDSEETVDTSTEAVTTFPEIVHRELKEETEALQIQSQLGVISDRTLSARLDLDWEEEQEQIKREELLRGDDEEEEFPERDGEIDGDPSEDGTESEPGASE